MGLLLTLFSLKLGSWEAVTPGSLEAGKQISLEAMMLGCLKVIKTADN